MKHAYAISAFILACVGAHAQKVDLDRFTFSVENYRLPAAYVAPAERTYAVSVVRSPMARGMISEREAATALRIAGYREASDGEAATVRIEVVIGNMLFERSEVVAHPDVRKDKEGRTDTTWTFSVDAYFRAAGGYTIAGPGVATRASASSNPFLQGVATAERPAGRRFSEGVPTGGVVKHSTAIFRSRKEAERNVIQTRDAVAARLYTDFIAATLRTAAARGNTLYGYVPIREEHGLWILDYKHHPEYRAQQDAVAAVRTVMSGVRADDARDEAAQSLAAVMDYFRAIPAKYTGDDTRSRKLRYGAHYNLAALYLALDRPDLAAEEARLLVENDFDAKDGRRLAERARELAARLAHHRLDGHYTRR